MRKNKPKSVQIEIANKKTFIREYKWWIITPVCVLVIVYVIIYACFLGDGFLKPGKDLEKKDWLAFLGDYLSFSGTLIVSLIAIVQGLFFEKRDKKRIAAERMRSIQPILSVDIIDINSQLSNTAEWVNLNDVKDKPQHKNVIIEIENAGQYPICNVIIFDKYLLQMLKPNEKQRLQIVYSDSPDAKRKDRVIEIIESEFERTDQGIPKSFNINYDDADGNVMFQTFVLKEFSGKQYYSFEGRQQV